MKALSITLGIEKSIAKWAMANRLLVAYRSELAMWAHSLAKAAHRGGIGGRSYFCGVIVKVST